MKSKELDELKKSVPMWRLVQDRIPNLERDGNEYKCLCPFHNESTPSFKIYQDKEGNWLFKCFGCTESGNVFQFLQKYDKISFEEAVQKVKSFQEWTEGKENVETTFQPMLDKKEEVVTFSVDRLIPSERELAGNISAIAWLTNRGISLETSKRFRLGYIQTAKAVNENHPWVNDGWILFPTIEGDTITCLKYRSIKGKKTPDGQSGFLRKKGMATGLYNAQTIQPFEDVYLVEGEIDCLTMAQAGYISVSIPSAGFSLTPEMKDKLLQANRIFLAGDRDSVGEQTMLKIWTELRDRTYYIKWENAKDANEVYMKTCGGSVEKFKAEVERLKKKALESPMPFMHDLKETLQQADDTNPLDNPARLRFPWPNIDKWTPIVPGDIMTLFATETGAGKTSWLMGILLENSIKYNKTVANYSAELPPAQYARRAAACLIGANRDSLTKEQFNAAANLMGEAKFYNGYKPGADYKEAIELLKWAKRRLGADILVVDHLHFLTRGEKDEVKAQGEAMRLLKDLAIEYNCIVIVVGQPRKAQANHRGREAVTQDFKGSETGGSDASQVFILHRDRLPTNNAGDSPIFDPVTKVKLDKSRESETRVTRLFFEGKTCRFINTITDKAMEEE